MLPPPPDRHLEAAPPPPDTCEPLEAATPPSGTGQLLEAITRLAEQVARGHERAGHREQIIDRLHAENQELRHGLLQEALAPVRAGLYRLYDTVQREASRWQGPQPPSAEHVGALLEAVTEEVAEVLARTGVERIETTPGEPYDRGLHRPVGTEPVETDRDGLVVAVLADGFASGERVLRKAGVVVGRAPVTAPAPVRTEDSDEGNT